MRLASSASDAAESQHAIAAALEAAPVCFERPSGHCWDGAAPSAACMYAPVCLSPHVECSAFNHNRSRELAQQTQHMHALASQRSLHSSGCRQGPTAAMQHAGEPTSPAQRCRQRTQGRHTFRSMHRLTLIASYRRLEGPLPAAAPAPPAAAAARPGMRLLTALR